MNNASPMQRRNMWTLKGNIDYFLNYYDDYYIFYVPYAVIPQLSDQLVSNEFDYLSSLRWNFADYTPWRNMY